MFKIKKLQSSKSRTHRRRADELVNNHKSSALSFIQRKKQPYGYFLGAVLIKAFAVALTTSNDRSSQTESIRRRFSTSESLDGFSGQKIKSAEMFNSRTSLCRTSKLGFLPSFSIRYRYRSVISTLFANASMVIPALSRAALMIHPSVSGLLCTYSGPQSIIWTQKGEKKKD